MTEMKTPSTSDNGAVAVVIAAAVATMLQGRPFRVRSISLAQPTHSFPSPWSYAGRTQLHTSHIGPTRW